MSLRRTLSAALIVAVVLGFGGGCSLFEDTQQVLRDSTAEIANGNYTFTSTVPDHSSVVGIVHKPSRSLSLSFKNAGDSSATKIVGGYRYVTITGSPKALRTGRNWTRVDLSRLQKAQQYAVDGPELTGAATLLAHTNSAERDGSAIFGTLDGSKVTAMITTVGGTIKGVWSDADVAPFRFAPYAATLDDEGRLTGLVITMPQLGLIPPGAWTVSITGYGEAEPVTAPEAADVVDEDDSYYELVNK